VHLIEWDAEPGSKDANGQLMASALSDFVLLIEPAKVDGMPRRLSVQTFPPSSGG
jgi:hypothetical protein